MFIVRNATLEDTLDLYQLSKQAFLLNLPQSKSKIEKKVLISLESFQNHHTSDLAKNNFIFVLEDTLKNKVAGVSMIHGQHGTPSAPHYYLSVGEEKKYSSTLNKELIHGTLKLGHEQNGHTEIGGLILDQDYRGNPNKLGKFLSISRFLFIAQFPELFTEYIHSELLPPFTPDGKSLLWEALGRKFLNMEYWEADQLSQTNKEFILNLFPESTIYTNLLPVEAINSIGKVGEQTQPVKKMLEKIGFKYTKEIDPFDGGPHYRAKKSELAPVKSIFKGNINHIGSKTIHNSFPAIITRKSSSHLFIAENIKLFHASGSEYNTNDKLYQAAPYTFEGIKI